MIEGTLTYFAAHAPPMPPGFRYTKPDPPKPTRTRELLSLKCGEHGADFFPEYTDGDLVVLERAARDLDDLDVTPAQAKTSTKLREHVAFMRGRGAYLLGLTDSARAYAPSPNAGRTWAEEDYFAVQVIATDLEAFWAAQKEHRQDEALEAIVAWRYLYAGCMVASLDPERMASLIENISFIPTL